MDIDLKTISKDLITSTEELGRNLTKLMPLEMQYQSRLDELQLQSQQTNQYQREAEARKIIMTEDIYLKYQELKLEVKLGYKRVDTLMEVGRNIRSYAFNES